MGRVRAVYVALCSAVGNEVAKPGQIRERGVELFDGCALSKRRRGPLQQFCCRPRFEDWREILIDIRSCRLVSLRCPVQTVANERRTCGDHCYQQEAETDHQGFLHVCYCYFFSGKANT